MDPDLIESIKLAASEDETSAWEILEEAVAGAARLEDSYVLSSSIVGLDSNDRHRWRPLMHKRP